MVLCPDFSAWQYTTETSLGRATGKILDLDQNSKDGRADGQLREESIAALQRPRCQKRIFWPPGGGPE